jgi:hypothetical protein
VFLQHPIEVYRVLGVGGKGTRPSEVILLDCLGLEVLGVMLHAHSPKGMLGSREPIFPRDHGAFPTVQLSFSGGSSSTTADVTSMLVEGEGLHPPARDDQHHDEM